MNNKRMCLLLIVMVLLAFVFVFAYAEDGVVAFEKKEYELLKGKSERIVPVIQGIKGNTKYLFTSGDESIATVTNNGTVKAVAVGDVTVNCVVTIGEQDYNCSYTLKVLQPVEKIEVAYKTITVPHDALLPLSFFTVLPEDAANKEIEITSNNQRNVVAAKNGIAVLGSATITAKATDGSNVKASFNVTVPKVAWFSTDTIEINEPEGAKFLFLPTTGNGMFRIGYGIENKKIATSSEEEVEGRGATDLPFELMFGRYNQATITPIKEGTTKYTVSVNGKKASVKVVVRRSAVYEQLDYNKAIKQSDKIKDLRFMAEGSLLKTEEIESVISYIIAYKGDESKPIKLITESEVPNMADSDNSTNIIAHGIYLGIEEYTSETGLLLSIPVIQLEKVALTNR